MNLLLILSALLSALSGMGQAVRGGRGPDAVCAACAVAAKAVPARQVAVARRPAMALPRPERAVAMVLSAWRLIPGEPVFAGRRRE